MGKRSWTLALNSTVNVQKSDHVALPMKAKGKATQKRSRQSIWSTCKAEAAAGTGRGRG